ncbi:MAG: hypothetical protein U0904_10520 [Candidatus Nanopelagicales bacterium]|nr:hypothetical protein [Candidatus Nanopelagicales bacterium]
MGTSYAALRAAAFVFGCLLLASTFASLIRTFLIPRALASTIAHLSTRIVHAPFRLLARQRRSYFSRDAILAWVGPLIVLADLTILITFFIIAFGLIIFGMSDLSLMNSIYQAGSNLLTLGIVEPTGYSQDVIVFLSAFTGLTVIALLIGTLTTIYSVYLRREAPVSRLALEAGAPAWGPELLCRAALADNLPSLGGTYSAWAEWAAQVRLTQTVYPQLNLFRSPSGRQHWVVALIAVMDAAALHVAICRDAPRMEAVSLVMEGSRALTVLQPPHLVDPSRRKSPRAAAERVHGPEDGPTRVLRAIVSDAARTEADVPKKLVAELDRRPSTMHRDEFDHAWELMERASFPMDEHPNRAWLTFQRLREAYEHPAYALANNLQAVRAPWTGDRTPPTDVVWPTLSAALRVVPPEH